MVAKRSARAERTQAINQARSLVFTGPDDLRARFAWHTTAALVAELASLRPVLAALSATRPGSRCVSWAGARSSSMPSWRASMN
jgi:hypothetical protein